MTYKELQYFLNHHLTEEQLQQKVLLIGEDTRGSDCVEACIMVEDWVDDDGEGLIPISVWEEHSEPGDEAPIVVWKKGDVHLEFE